MFKLKTLHFLALVCLILSLTHALAENERESEVQPDTEKPLAKDVEAHPLPVRTSRYQVRRRKYFSRALSRGSGVSGELSNETKSDTARLVSGVGTGSKRRGGLLKKHDTMNTRTEIIGRKSRHRESGVARPKVETKQLLQKADEAPSHPKSDIKIENERDDEQSPAGKGSEEENTHPNEPSEIIEPAAKDEEDDKVNVMMQKLIQRVGAVQADPFMMASTEDSSDFETFQKFVKEAEAEEAKKGKNAKINDASGSIASAVEKSLKKFQ